MKIQDCALLQICGCMRSCLCIRLEECLSYVLCQLSAQCSQDMGRKMEEGYCLQALEKVSSILVQERGNLTVEEQIHQLLQSLQHDSASVKATALQVMPACVQQQNNPPM